jgi:hypothetical protein
MALKMNGLFWNALALLHKQSCERVHESIEMRHNLQRMVSGLGIKVLVKDATADVKSLPDGEGIRRSLKTFKKFEEVLALC